MPTLRFSLLQFPKIRRFALDFRTGRRSLLGPPQWRIWNPAQMLTILGVFWLSGISVKDAHSGSIARVSTAISGMRTECWVGGGERAMG
jgi:hypothetical protein